MCMRRKEKIEFVKRCMMKQNCFSAKRLENILYLGKRMTREEETKGVGDDKQMSRDSNGS